MIFLTGATGHTGSRVARALAERGQALCCLVHTPEHAKYLPPEAQVVFGDVSDMGKLAESMRGAEACLHLAHIRHAHIVAQACRQAGVERFICLSSTRRYTRFPCETSEAVIRGEAAVENSGLQWTILRPSMIYGGQRDNNLERLVRWFRRTPLFPLVSGGRNLVQPVFVGDVVAAVLEALERPQAIAKSYTLAGPEPLAWREMVEGAAQVAGRAHVIFFPIPFKIALTGTWILSKVSTRSTVTCEQVRRLLEDKAFDIGPARRELDFAPVSFEEGLRCKGAEGA